MDDDRVGVLFVCLGNICRSPLAEGVFRALVDDAGLGDRFDIDSAGTSSWHVGEPPDERTAAVARRRGVDVTGSSRRVKRNDLDRFQHILAMDTENLHELARLADRSGSDADIRRLRDYDPVVDGLRDVPDPYYGGSRGFENVHDIVERSCRALLEDLRSRYGM